MKNPLAYIKHLVKDPITTVDECDKRKKEVLPWLLGSAVVAVVPGILSGVLDMSFLSVISILGIFATMFFGFLFWVTITAKKKFEALTCDKCNTLAKFATVEEYLAHVSYVEGKHEAVFKGISHPASNNGVVAQIEAKGSASAIIYIDLKCPHCGNVKKLEYHIDTFKCSAVQKKVAVRDVEFVKSKLETAVRTAVNDYNDPEKRTSIPYSIHSSKHPQYENRAKPQFSKKFIPEYYGANIDFHKDVEEAVRHFFFENLLNGKIIDPNKKKKGK